MVRYHILFAATIAVGCLLACTATASAGTTRPSRVLVAQFGESAGIPRPGAPQPELVSRMEDEFDDVTAEVDRPDPPARIGDAFLRIPMPRIPGWMLTGKTPERRLATSALVQNGNCDRRPYQPSAILAPESEERRRIFYPLVRRAACEAGLPIGLMDAMLIQESRYNPLAVSPKGAFGLGQLMPGTAVQLGVNRYDLRGNLAGAARYLRQHIDEFGQVPLALAAYNAGPGRVRRTWTVPRIGETENYVRQILSNWRALEMASMQRDGGPAASAARRTARISSFP